MNTPIERESMEYDVVIVGAGVAGLSSAIRLKQLAHEKGEDLSVCVLEKGSQVGAHILSGAVLDTKALHELLPDWQNLGAPISCAVKRDKFLFLTKKKAFRLPAPRSFHNKGNFIVSLSLVCRWLAEQAENLGVEIYPGFAASEILYHKDGSVKGVATGDMGVDKNGEQGLQFQPGMELLGRQTIFAEGCRGSLSKELIAGFALDRDSQPQTYGLGIKEIWEVLPEQSRTGEVMHTIGWPLEKNTYGGSFMYHLDDNKVAVGFVVGLDYENPYLSPFEEFQRFKTHPAIRATLEGGRRIAYGARALVEGGLQSLPRMSFPGGVLVGDAAGFLNVPRIKGTHTAMKSGMLAAEAVWDVLQVAVLNDVANDAAGDTANSHVNGKVLEPADKEATGYASRFRASWLYGELKRVRNIRPAFKWGLFPALCYGALEEYVLQGRGSWTLKHHAPDYRCLKKASECKAIDYPKPDGQLTFDRLSSVFLSGTFHEENQPSHLKLLNESLAISVNYKQYASPETRYCPAGVYEILQDETGSPRLQINAQNCLHCKTCDIKDPKQNIRWQAPEGGGGPNYEIM